MYRNIFRTALHRHVYESRSENSDIRRTAARGMNYVTAPIQLWNSSCTILLYRLH